MKYPFNLRVIYLKWTGASTATYTVYNGRCVCFYEEGWFPLTDAKKHYFFREWT